MATIRHPIIFRSSSNLGRRRNEIQYDPATLDCSLHVHVFLAMSIDDKANEEHALHNDKAELLGLPHHRPQPVMSVTESSVPPHSCASKFTARSFGSTRPLLTLLVLLGCFYFFERAAFITPWLDCLQTVESAIGMCPQAPVPSHDPATEVYETDGFRKMSLERLQGAIRIQSSSRSRLLWDDRTALLKSQWCDLCSNSPGVRRYGRPAGRYVSFQLSSEHFSKIPMFHQIQNQKTIVGSPS